MKAKLKLLVKCFVPVIMLIGLQVKVLACECTIHGAGKHICPKCGKHHGGPREYIPNFGYIRSWVPASECVYCNKNRKSGSQVSTRDHERQQDRQEDLKEDLKEEKRREKRKQKRKEKELGEKKRKEVKIQKEEERRRSEEKKREEARLLKEKRQNQASVARANWDQQDKESTNAFKQILSSDKKKLKKLLCIFCVDGMRTCPDCHNGIVKCSRSGCINGKHICGCVSSANNYKPDPNCRFCHGSGVTICEACHGKGSWTCPSCGGKGKIPCIFCKGLSIAESVADIRSTVTGPTAIKPFSAFENTNRAIIRQAVGPDGNWNSLSSKDLARLCQLQGKLVQTQQRQIESTNIDAPDNRKSSEATAAQQELDKRISTLAKQVVAKVGGIPADVAERAKLTARIKATVNNDAKVSKLTVEPIKKAGPRSQVKGSLGVRVAPTEGMLRAAFTEYEKDKWNLESYALKNQKLAESKNTSSSTVMNILCEKYGADFEKSKGYPGAPATFDEYIVKRSKTDPSCRMLNKAVKDYYFSGTEHSMCEDLAKSRLQMDEKEFNKLLDSSSSAPVIAIKIRRKMMAERYKQLEEQIEQKRKELKEHEKKIAKLEREKQKTLEAFNRRLESERSQAEKEYKKFSASRQKTQSFENYLFAKVADTPEGRGLLKPDCAIDIEGEVLRQNLNELNQIYDNLRKKGTILSNK